MPVSVLDSDLCIMRACRCLSGCGIALLCLLVAPASWAGQPLAAHRIVSMNLCTDELAVRLLDPARLLSVTWLSQDARISNVAAQARRMPPNRGFAEEIVGFRPDLVIAGRYTTRMTVALLQRSGVPVLDLDVPVDVAGMEKQIGDLSILLGEEVRGQKLLSGIERRLAAIPQIPDKEKPGAIVLKPNGFTVGRGSLVDDILTRAGLRNLAAEQGLERYGQVPLEIIADARPDILIVDGEPGDGRTLAFEILNHPLLKHLPLHIVRLPSRLWTCAGPGVVDAIALLSRAAIDVRKERRGS
ncbi:MAG: ABC transporter substrate-binding protein [Parvibaculaceae bacterium]|nr:ABC transporter substrate-binding protein [Parvibaculaceae bacterium]